MQIIYRMSLTPQSRQCTHKLHETGDRIVTLKIMFPTFHSKRSINVIPIDLNIQIMIVTDSGWLWSQYSKCRLCYTALVFFTTFTAEKRPLHNTLFTSNKSTILFYLQPEDTDDN